MRAALLLLLLAGCAQTEIVGCPEVRVWSRVDQKELLSEQEDVEADHPMIKRALAEYYQMRVESRPCALMPRRSPI
jgi:hypothetical protein